MACQEWVDRALSIRCVRCRNWIGLVSCLVLHYLCSAVDANTTLACNQYSEERERRVLVHILGILTDWLASHFMHLVLFSNGC